MTPATEATEAHFLASVAPVPVRHVCTFYNACTMFFPMDQSRQAIHLYWLSRNILVVQKM